MDISFKKPRFLHNSSLQTRFLLRVLVPPFLILVIISVTGYVFLSTAVRGSATDSLQRSAQTTAAKLEREFSLRQTILTSTGSQLFALENKDSTYVTQLTDLNSNYQACLSFVVTNSNFVSAPHASCEPFYARLLAAQQAGQSLSQAVKDGYRDNANTLTTQESTAANQLLASFAHFFPETSRLLVVDATGQIVSQSQTENTQSSDSSYAQSLKAIAKQALKKPVEATYASDGGTQQMIFAHAITQGSTVVGAVLASYDIDNSDFLYPSWKSTPIDSSDTYVVIADTKTQASYPNIKDKSLYVPALDKTQASFTSSKIQYLAVSAPISGTDWRVIVSSPAAIALAPLANTQILAVAIAGVLLVSFLWVGSRFVHRTVGSILELVGGAIMFANDGLTHRINTTHMSDKEFSQLAEIMNNMAIKIQAAEAAIVQKDKEFINVATHEIKAPMTAIIGNLSMLLDDGMGQVDDDARLLAGQAYKSTLRLRDLVNELLDIARLESGRAEFHLGQVDIGAVIGDMVTLQQTVAAEHQVTIQYDTPTAPLAVTADKTKLEIILTNFISNAIKYNRSPGSVTITQAQVDGFVQIAIQDTGLGIPAEQQAKMFQKFFRVEASDRAGIPGTGLGMYITKQFIEGMGGRLWFESEHGKGTIFHFTLPLAEGKKIPRSDTDVAGELSDK